HATSSATSKLIHGGMRYLANLEYGLVRESLRERRTMENIAPNFVYPFPMLMAHTASPLKNNKWLVKSGMISYDLLAFDKARTWDASKKIPNHRTLTTREALSLQPNLKREGLTGASVFYDCVSIFPERLTLAFIKSAQRWGARVSNYARVEEFLLSGRHRVTGVKVKDLVSGKEHEVQGSIVINCGGPWADLILGLARQGGIGEKLVRSEGIHIITKKELIGDSHVVGSMTAKGRHFFLIPWRGHTLIGTTDKKYIGNPDDYRVTKASILELIDEVNASFGDGSLGYEDVQYAYGGLRPLVEEQTSETYTSSRRYEIYDNATDGLDGLITVEGGKYTTSRNLAENTLNLVREKTGWAMGQSVSGLRYLQGCRIRDVEAFVTQAKRDYPDFAPKTMEYLARNYGTEYGKIVSLARQDSDLSEIVTHDGEILAEVVHAVRDEMALTLPDIVLRRTGIGTLGNPGGEVLEKVAHHAGHELGWNQDRVARELADTLSILRVPTE
ncbi:MAG TPA: glycerol-3-phosphate dehydrogenase/oxidase, partial [Deltaproteobacteria bacterium]|nr:glycerol-3-phosphate dehydrogenase/oxidase [Deltaproteobacteria bacterium]